MAEEELVEYIVREGKTFGVDKKAAGESVFLTAKQAEAFADLVEPRVKPRKGDQKEDTRDTAKASENIGVRTSDEGTAKDKKK